MKGLLVLLVCVGVAAVLVLVGLGYWFAAAVVFCCLTVGGLGALPVVFARLSDPSRYFDIGEDGGKDETVVVGRGGDGSGGTGVGGG